MRTYYTAQGTLLGALWLPQWEGNPGRKSRKDGKLNAGQEATVKTTDWFQVGKGVHQGCIMSPCLFNLYAEYIMRNAGLDEHKQE